MTTTTFTTDEVERVLAQVGRDVRRAMLDAIPDAEPHQWLYELVRTYPSRPGKAIRPALCLATCRAFGGSDTAAFPVAVAIEMLHNAFLVHDDIADGSERRRGRPTLPAAYGQDLSLNAGDALVVLANQVLRRHSRSLDPALADLVLDEFDTMAMRTLEGQATELGWRRDRVTDLSPEDYLDLILHKTCWYTTIHPLRVGALLGSGGPAPLRAMVHFGFYIGAAFQIRDDLLNLTGDEDLYGKEINGDLYEAKRSLAMIHLANEARGTTPRSSSTTSRSNVLIGRRPWSPASGRSSTSTAASSSPTSTPGASPWPPWTPTRRPSRGARTATTPASSGRWSPTCWGGSRDPSRSSAAYDAVVPPDETSEIIGQITEAGVHLVNANLDLVQRMASRATGHTDAGEGRRAGRGGLVGLDRERRRPRADLLSHRPAGRQPVGLDVRRQSDTT